MPRLTVALLVAALLWIAWCVLVVTELVPVIGRHVTMWPWLMSYILCLAPVVALAIFAVNKLKVNE